MEYNQASLETLLKQVHEISERYKEEERISGDNFNIFKILDIHDKELIHSRFLRMLLDPEGDHGQGDLFLKLFIQSVLPEISIKNYQSIKVFREHDIGKYGRLDIFIQCETLNLAIENKIHDQDSCGQIQKYDCYLNEKFPNNNNYILYLTLNGSPPINSDISKIEKRLICKSYKVDIIEWLESCNEKCSNLPLLHETIVQYINIIKTLTGQTRSKKMKQELIKLLLSDANYIKDVHTIYELFPETIDSLIKENIVDPLINEGLEFKLKFNVKQQYYGYSFFRKEWKDIGWDNIKLRFEFCGAALSFSGFMYGIWGNNTDLVEYFKKDGALQTDNTILIKKIEGYNDWIKGGIFPKLASQQNEVLRELKALLSRLDEIAKTKKLE